MFSLVPRCQGARLVLEGDLDAGVDGELQVFGHLPAVVPGEGAAQLLGQAQDGGGQRWAHALGGEHVRQGEQQQIAAAALDQGPDRAGPPAEHQVAFPMPGHRPVGGLGGSLAEVEGVSRSCPRPWGSRLPRG